MLSSNIEHAFSLCFSISIPVSSRQFLPYLEFSAALGIRSRALTRAAAGFQRPPLKRAHDGSKMMTTVFDHTPVAINNSSVGTGGLGVTKMAKIGVMPWLSSEGVSVAMMQGPEVALPSSMAPWADQDVDTSYVDSVFGVVDSGTNLLEKSNLGNEGVGVTGASDLDSPIKPALQDPGPDRKLRRRKELQMTTDNIDLRRHCTALQIPADIIRDAQAQLADYVASSRAVRSVKTLGAAALYNVLREHPEHRPDRLQHLTHQGVADLTGVSKSAIQRTSHQMRQ